MKIRKTVDDGRGSRNVLTMPLDGEFHEWASDYVDFNSSLAGGIGSVDATAERVIFTRNNIVVTYEPVEEESTK